MNQTDNDLSKIDMRYTHTLAHTHAHMHASTHTMCTVETRPVKDIDLVTDDKSKYNIWKKNRKQRGGGGVMMLI